MEAGNVDVLHGHIGEDVVAAPRGAHDARHAEGNRVAVGIDGGVVIVAPAVHGEIPDRHVLKGAGAAKASADQAADVPLTRHNLGVLKRDILEGNFCGGGNRTDKSGADIRLADVAVQSVVDGHIPDGVSLSVKGDVGDSRAVQRSPLQTGKVDIVEQDDGLVVKVDIPVAVDGTVERHQILGGADPDIVLAREIGRGLGALLGFGSGVGGGIGLGIHVGVGFGICVGSLLRCGRCVGLGRLSGCAAGGSLISGTGDKTQHQQGDKRQAEHEETELLHGFSSFHLISWGCFESTLLF